MSSPSTRRKSRQTGMKPLALMLLAVLALAVAWSAAPAWADDGEPAVAGSIEVRGLSCPFCARGLQTKIRDLAWVADVTVYVDDGRADFTVRQGRVPEVNALQTAVRDAGFTPGTTTLRARGQVERSGSDVLLVVGEGARLVLAAGAQRDRLLDEVGSSGRSVRVEGTAQTRGERTHVTVRSYRLL